MRALVITNSITKRDSKSVEKYLNDISKYEVMTPEEELDAFKRFKNGEKHAFQKIIQCNLRFVVSVAKQYQHTGLSLNDLINEGNLGLIKAAERFDYTKGFKFISYAVWWIRQTILQAVNDKARKIRLPLNHQTNTMKLLRTRDELVQRLEREPSIDELAKATGMSHEEIVKSFQTHKFTRSLNAPVDSDGEATLETFLEDDSMMSPDHEVSEKESLRTEVAELLGTLSLREAEVLACFYGINGEQARSLDDIGDRIGVSRERVRQIKDRALRKLRRKVRHNELPFHFN